MKIRRNAIRLTLATAICAAFITSLCSGATPAATGPATTPATAASSGSSAFSFSVESYEYLIGKTKCESLRCDQAGSLNYEFEGRKGTVNLSPASMNILRRTAAEYVEDPLPFIACDYSICDGTPGAVTYLVSHERKACFSYGACPSRSFATLRKGFADALKMSSCSDEARHDISELVRHFFGWTASSPSEEEFRRSGGLLIIRNKGIKEIVDDLEKVGDGQVANGENRAPERLSGALRRAFDHVAYLREPGLGQAIFDAYQKKKPSNKLTRLAMLWTSVMTGCRDALPDLAYLVCADEEMRSWGWNEGLLLRGMGIDVKEVLGKIDSRNPDFGSPRFWLAWLVANRHLLDMPESASKYVLKDGKPLPDEKVAEVMESWRKLLEADRNEKMVKRLQGRPYSGIVIAGKMRLEQLIERVESGLKDHLAVDWKNIAELGIDPRQELDVVVNNTTTFEELLTQLEAKTVSSKGVRLGHHIRDGKVHWGPVTTTKPN